MKPLGWELKIMLFFVGLVGEKQETVSSNKQNGHRISVWSILTLLASRRESLNSHSTDPLSPPITP